MSSLEEIKLVAPVHLRMVSDGHGEFPDGYKLTPAGIEKLSNELLGDVLVLMVDEYGDWVVTKWKTADQATSAFPEHVYREARWVK